MNEIVAFVQESNDLWGILTFTAGAVAAIATIFMIAWKGLFVWYRIGKGLAKRKIAIFAETEFDSLKDLLVDSGLIREKNIIKIGKRDMTKAENCSLYLVHYLPFKTEIDSILSQKKDKDALIVYTPLDEGRIEPDHLEKIGKQRNTTTVNFPGRLLNDVFVSMITTSFK